MRQAATPSTVLLPTRWWFTHAAAEGSSSGGHVRGRRRANHVDDAQRCPRTSPQPGRASGVHQPPPPPAARCSGTRAGGGALRCSGEDPAGGTTGGHRRAPLGRVAAHEPPSAMALVRGRVPPLHLAGTSPGEQNLGTTTAEERGVAGERAAGVRDERPPASPEDDRLGSRRLVHGRPAPVRRARRGAVALLVTVLVLTSAVAGGAVWHPLVPTSPRSTCRRPSGWTARGAAHRGRQHPAHRLRHPRGRQQRHVRHGAPGARMPLRLSNLLVHLSADQTWATVVSIPRDSMTPAPPDCSPTAKAEWTSRQWNKNFALGSTGASSGRSRATPGCSSTTTRLWTSAVQTMVDALGGVTVCADAIDDPVHLRLAAGRRLSSTASSPSRTCAPASRWATARTSVASGDSRPSCPR